MAAWTVDALEDIIVTEGVAFKSSWLVDATRVAAGITLAAPPNASWRMSLGLASLPPDRGVICSCMVGGANADDGPGWCHDDEDGTMAEDAWTVLGP